MSSIPEHEHTPIEVQPEVPLISQRFCAADSDIAIQSSDGVLFQLHQVNLKISSGSWKVGMPNGQLLETSAVLDLLFQFCYPERRPDLEKLEFAVLAKLTEAVEKYKVFSAMDVCKIAMIDKLPVNAFDILIYGGKHRYSDVYQKAAPLVVLQQPMSEVLPRLPSDLLMPWVLYHEKWLHVACEAVYYHEIWAKDHSPRISKNRSPIYYGGSCGHLVDVGIANSLLRRLGAGLESYVNIETLFESPCNCKHPEGIFSQWRRSVEDNIANIPLFNGQSLPPIDSAMQSVSTAITCQNEASERAISARFSAPDSDVIFLSSDSVLFHLHKINLIVSAGGFAPPEFETPGESIRLTETALILELLFQFCYPDHLPDVEMLEFSQFTILAEAAEKYQVYSAMNICKIRMKKLLPNHATDILIYAAWHDYPDIMDIAAPSVVRKERLSDTLLKLPQHLVIRWVKYFEAVRLPSPFLRLNNRDDCDDGEREIAIPIFSTIS